MIEDLLICLKAVAPLFIYMLIGVLVRRTGIIASEDVRKLNHFAFVVFFPCLMFENVCGADIGKSFNVKLIGYGLASILTIYFLSVLLTVKMKDRPAMRGAVIQAVYRSNFVIMGLPVAMNIYGRGNLSITAMMIAVIVPLFNILAVITLEYFRSGRPNVRVMTFGIIKNPLIIGTLTGIAVTISGYEIPQIPEDIISDMGSIATPLALIILGASFEFSSVGRMKRELIICVLARLVIVPGIFVSAAAMLGFEDIELISLLAMFAAPAAISSYTMAEEMGSDSELAGNVVIFSFMSASFTMFLWLFIFKTLGLF